MGGGDPSRDIKVLDLLGGQFEVNSVLTFILSRYWIGESIANSSQQWCAITNLYGLTQKCQLTTDKHSLPCPKPTQETIVYLKGNPISATVIGLI
jgi:hypothetical protein